jgi:hypothetical protein
MIIDNYSSLALEKQSSPCTSVCFCTNWRPIHSGPIPRADLEARLAVIQRRGLRVVMDFGPKRLRYLKKTPSTISLLPNTAPSTQYRTRRCKCSVRPSFPPCLSTLPTAARSTPRRADAPASLIPPRCAPWPKSHWQCSLKFSTAVTPRRCAQSCLLHPLDSGQPLEGPVSLPISRIGHETVDAAVRSARLKQTVKLAA